MTIRRTCRSLVLLALLALPGGCGDGGGPNLHGPPGFTATMNGMQWEPDTAVGILYASVCDTTLLVAAIRSLTPQDEEAVLLDVRRFRGPGSFVLSDTATGIFAAYLRTHTIPGSGATTQSQWTTPAAPGQLTIHGLTASDSLMSGSFAFETVATPDTAAHHVVRGHFRVRYSLRPVYVVACDPAAGASRPLARADGKGPSPPAPGAESSH